MVYKNRDDVEKIFDNVTLGMLVIMAILSIILIIVT